MWLDWLTQLGQFIAMAVVVWSCLKTLEAQPNTGFLRVWFQLILYNARYFMLWLMLWSGVMLLLSSGGVIYWMMLFIAILYIYANWIEPNCLKVTYTSIYFNQAKSTDAFTNFLSQEKPQKPLKIAVLSDIHVGIFSGKPHQLSQLVKTLNGLDVAAVLIAGDWLYHAGADILGQMVVLKALNKPCYTVLSEQDNQQIPSEIDSQNQLPYVLKTLGIQVTNDTSVVLDNVLLIGTGTASNFSYSPSQLQKNSTHQPLLILTHDIKNLAENANHLLYNENPKLIIAGQTHGGQVHIPYLTNRLVQAMTGTRERAGLSIYAPDRRSRYQVWTTSGIGMTGLPFRLNCPPSIDVLTLYVG